MIELQYIIICILGWGLGILTNEIFVWEIREERESFPLSQVLKRFRSPRILKPLKNSLFRWQLLIKGKIKKNKKAGTGIVLDLSLILTTILVYTRYDTRGVGIGVLTFIFLLIVISVIDLYTMRIPNRLNLILAVLNISFIPLGWSVSWQEALHGALLGGGILIGIRIFSLIFLK